MKVLFIEDDAMNRRVVRDMLNVAGVEMVEAEDAARGIALIAGEDALDAVLVDLRMPGMDGFEAMKLIRARTDGKEKLPLIVVTADTAPDLVERCRAAGADEVLYKPVAMDALFETIGRVMANRAG